MLLRHKLVLAQLPLWVALVGLAAAAVCWSLQLGDSAQRILADNQRSILALQRMRDALDTVRIATPAAAVGAEVRSFEEALRIQEGNITEPGEADATAALRAAWDAYRSAQPGGRDEAGYAAVRAPLARVLALNQDALVRKSDRATALSRRIPTLLVVAAAMALAFGVWASASLARRLLRPLGSLTEAARRVGEHDFAVRADDRGDDEVGHLAGEFNRMVDRLRQYQESTLGDLLQAHLASQAALDSLPDPVLVLGTDGRPINRNEAARQALGGWIDESPSERPLERLPPALREAIERARVHVLAGRGPFAPAGFEDAVAVDAAGEPRWYLVRGQPVYQEPTGITAATILLQDITRLRLFDEVKTDLVATVAHELRTPLTSLRMALHMLAEGAAGDVDPRQADLIGAAREDGERLRRLIDDLLDLSRLQQRSVGIERSRVAVGDLVEAALRDAQSAAQARGIALRSRIDPAADAVLGDEGRLAIVLANLLANAIRHSPEHGEVEVEAVVEPDCVRFAVLDHGPGIAPDERERIFAKFARGVGAIGTGAGLGLWIAAEIVRAHDGRIGVDASPAGGSRFWFTVSRA